MDWIRLPSGEWLAGEITGLRDDEFLFDSEELDDLAFEWGDIIEIRSPRILTYAFTNKREVTGTGAMKDGVLKVRVGEEVLEFPRAMVLSIIEGKPTEWNYWSAKISFGLIARTGNTEQEDLNTVVLLRRQTTRGRLNLEYKGNFSKTRSEQTVNNHRGDISFDYLINRGFFITPAAITLFADEFQNIRIRGTFGAGAGYFVIRHSKMEWYFSLGGGYQVVDYLSVEPGEPQREESFALVPATRFEWDITGSIELESEYNAQVTIPEVKNTVHHAFALLSFELTSIFDFDTSLTWDRVETPKRDADGNLPKRDDFRLSFALALDF
jgi:putative salt-induced outer membrane protein YdiY